MIGGEDNNANNNVVIKSTSIAPDGPFWCYSSYNAPEGGGGYCLFLALAVRLAGAAVGGGRSGRI